MCADIIMVILRSEDDLLESILSYKLVTGIRLVINLGDMHIFISCKIKYFCQELWFFIL